MCDAFVLYETSIKGKGMAQGNVEVILVESSVVYVKNVFSVDVSGQLDVDSLHF